LHAVSRPAEAFSTTADASSISYYRTPTMSPITYGKHTDLDVDPPVAVHPARMLLS
jgi:hypothetical protein